MAVNCFSNSLQTQMYFQSLPTLQSVLTETSAPRGGISGWGCAAGTLEPLTFTRASSAEFCYPILE